MKNVPNFWLVSALIGCLLVGGAFFYRVSQKNESALPGVPGESVSTTTPSTNPSEGVPAVPTSTVSGEKVVKTLSSTYKGTTVVLMQSCDGTIKQADAGLEASTIRDYCIGKNTLSFQMPSGDSHVLQTIVTKTEHDSPSLWSAELLDDNRLLFSYFVKDYEDRGPRYEAFAPFMNPPNILLDLSTKKMRTIKNMPFESEPLWNETKTKAVFAPGGDSMAGGPYPLIGYDLSTDKRYTLTKEKVGGPCCRETFVAYPHWESVRWIDEKTVEAIHVSVVGKKTIRVTVPPAR